MKKLSFKSLESSYIKRVCKSWLLIGLVTAFCVSSCSEDNGESAKAPEFPEKKSISCNAGETKEFTFDANLDWRLTSNAIWCKLEKDGTEDVTVSGSAGTQTVMIKVTDSEQTTGEASVAELELAMGGQTSVIAEITRSAKGYELKIYDMEGNEIEQLEVGYNTYIPFKVKANFRFAAKDFPDWISLKDGSLVGVPDEEVESGLQIVNDENREKYPVEASDENVITFADEAGKASFSFPVYYKGMTPGIINIEGPSSNKYNWVVSLDGKKFIQESSGTTGTGTDNITIQDEMQFTIKTLQDKYKIVFLEKGYADNKLYLMETAWMFCEGDKGTVSLTISTLDTNEGLTTRTGYVLAFSEEEYNSIKDNLPDAIIESNGAKDEIAYKYEQSNLMVQLTQKEVQESDEQSFTVKNAMTYTPIECTTYEEGDVESLKTKYGVTKVYEVKEPGNAKTVIVTAPFNISSMECFLKDNEEAYNDIEMSSETDVMVYLTVDEEPLNKDVCLVVGDENNNKLMLVIRASNSGSGEDSAVFNVINTMGSSIECTVYDGMSFGPSKYFMDNYNVSNIFEIKEPVQSMFITLTSSNISEYTCYDSEENVLTITQDITLEDYPFDMSKKALNVYLGGNEFGGASAIFLVIEGENGDRNMLFIHLDNQ